MPRASTSSVIELAVVSYDCDLFGSERSALDLFARLDRSKIRPRLVVPRAGPLEAAAKEAGVEVSVLPWLERPPLAAARLAVWLRLRGIHIVELNRLASYRHLAVVNAAAVLAGCKSIVRLRAACDALTPARKLTLRGSDLVVSVSREIMEPWRLGGLPPGFEKRVIIRPNTLDVHALKRLPKDPGLLRALGVPEGARVIGQVAAITPNKRQDLFLRAAQAILKEIPEAWFMIVGRGIGEDFASYKEELRSLAANKPLEERVVYAGYREDARALMKGLDVVMLPSDHEALARVVIEAMALGVPVIAHRTGGIPEVVEDGVTGLLVERQEPGLYAEAALRLLRDPELARRLAQGAARFVERLDNARGARAMERLYGALARAA